MVSEVKIEPAMTITCDGKSCSLAARPSFEDWKRARKCGFNGNPRQTEEELKRIYVRFLIAIDRRQAKAVKAFMKGSKN